MQKSEHYKLPVDEYRSMFDLSSDDLKMRLLDYSPTNGEHSLPLEDFSFDFALSANYLFAGLAGQTVDTTVQIIRELARVAKDVRIFPLVDRLGLPSSMLGPVLLKLQEENYGVEIRDVAYQLQPLGHAMLRVWAKQCLR